MPRAIEWAERLDLRRSGSEYCGPCPRCGGEDRFHVRDSGSSIAAKALVGCRGCIDYESPEVRSANYIEIVRMVFGENPAPVRRPRAKRVDRREIRRKAQKAARLAAKWIGESEYGPHPYLERKGFPEAQGLVHEGLLLIPIRHRKTGKLMSVQRIREDGRKLFIKGSIVKGGCFEIGRGRETWVTEGFATALSLQLALRQTYRDASILVAFSAANVKEVAQPGNFVVADNDKHGVGAKFATASKCPWWMPPEEGDANDYHLAHGIQALAKQLREFLRRSPYAT